MKMGGDCTLLSTHGTNGKKRVLTLILVVEARVTKVNLFGSFVLT